MRIGWHRGLACGRSRGGDFHIFLTRKPNSHLDFDLDLAREESNENPVYYVKYAHARICSVLRKAAAEGIEPGVITAESLGRLTEDAEWNLVRELIRLPQVIVSAANAREPHRLTGYIYDTSGSYRTAFLLCAGVTVVGVIAALVLRPIKRPPAAKENHA